jgi:hypothetical protein
VDQTTEVQVIFTTTWCFFNEWRRDNCTRAINAIGALIWNRENDWKAQIVLQLAKIKLDISKIVLETFFWEFKFSWVDFKEWPGVNNLLEQNEIEIARKGSWDCDSWLTNREAKIWILKVIFRSLIQRKVTLRIKVNYNGVS